MVHIMRKAGLENIRRTEQLKGKKDKENQRITYVASLSEWMAELGVREMTKRQKVVRATRYWK